MKLAIDAMGGDNAPQAVLEGVRLSLDKLPEAEFILYGEEGPIHAAIDAWKLPESRVRCEHTTEVIGCDESPTAAIRRKKDSSMLQALQDVADGKADCVVSAGSTGALLAGGTLIVRRLPGVKRPALGTVLPAMEGTVMLMDCGANADCKVEFLEQFAVMGSVYMREMMGIARPRVGLLNNGSEAEKGNELTKSAYMKFGGLPIFFEGNCEARDLFSGRFDVVIADGFTGNAVLKAVEGTAMMMMSVIKRELTSDLRSKCGAALVKPALKNVKKTLDYAEYGGAPLLGLRGGVIKAHGSSNAKAFMNAIIQAGRLVNGNVCARIAEGIREAGIQDQQD